MKAKKARFDEEEKSVPLSNTPKRAVIPLPLKSVIQMDPKDIAEQMTLLECQFLQAIQTSELLGQAWNREGKEINARNLLAYIDWFTLLRNWISTEILKGEIPSDRASLIDCFIHIAMKCHELRNYNGVMEVLSGLYSESIANLKQSWKELPKKATENLEHLSKLMSPQRNFRAYRVEIKKCIQSAVPCIPYLGVFLTDFVFLDETKSWKYGDMSSSSSMDLNVVLPMTSDDPGLLSQGMIHFEKVRTIGKFLLEFIAFQENLKSYKLQPLLKIQEYLLSSEIWEESDLQKMCDLYTSVENAKLDVPSGGVHSSQSMVSSSGAMSISFSSQQPSSMNSYAMRHGIKTSIGGRSNIATDIDSLTAREWDVLLTNATVVKYNRNEVIFEENHFNGHLYRIKKGKVRIEKAKPDNQRVILTTLSPPFMFGEMSFLGDSRASASVICDENNTELFVLEIKLVKKLFSNDPDLFRTFYQYLATILAKRLKNVGNAPNPNGESVTMEKSESSPKLPMAHSNPRREQEDSNPIRKEDVKFRKRFGLSDSEIIIKEYPCSQMHFHGRMYLSKQYVCFFSNVFGMKRKRVFSYSSLKAIWRNKSNSIELSTLLGSKVKFVFASDRERDLAFDMLESLWLSSSNISGSGNAPIRVPSTSSWARSSTIENSSRLEETDPESLTQENWDFLLRGSKLQTFHKDQKIVIEGQIFQRIYQIVSGVCRIEKTGVNRVLGTMEDGQMFGEISFLISGGATASVIADSEIVEVNVLEGYFINILFGMRPELAGRFYKHLANVLQKTIRSREASK